MAAVLGMVLVSCSITPSLFHPAEPSTPSAGSTREKSGGASATRTASNGNGRIQIHWQLGWTIGASEDEIRIQQSVADDFNASQDKIQLILDISDSYGGPEKDEVATMFMAGKAADIFGPMDWRGSNPFRDEWLDLAPYIQTGKFDIAQFNPALVEMYETPDGPIGLPFMVYPSAIFYNQKLFAKAGLNYPPAKYGEKYKMSNGSEVEWNWNTVRAVAQWLTRDAGDRKTTELGFDKGNIVQYGFTWQFENHPNYWGSYWAGGSMLAPGGSPGSYNAQVPDAWRASWEWTYDAIWGAHPFMGDYTVENSEDFSRGNAFDSGKVAMTLQPYWYTRSMGSLKDWDFAAMPVYQGKVGGRIDEYSLRIWKGTKHPQEAFTVLAYLLTEGVQKLIVGSESMPAQWSSSMPARTANQKDWLEIQKKKYPWVKNWDVLLAGLNYPDIPAADAYLPNYTDAWIRGTKFADLLRGTGGLDLTKEIQTYAGDLTNIFNK